MTPGGAPTSLMRRAWCDLSKATDGGNSQSMEPIHNKLNSYDRMKMFSLRHSLFLSLRVFFLLYKAVINSTYKWVMRYNSVHFSFWERGWERGKQRGSGARRRKKRARKWPSGRKRRNHRRLFYFIFSPSFFFFIPFFFLFCWFQ